MANWSQSHFLHSLGWATLNSFWQMALLWCIYCSIVYLFKMPSHRKYQLSVAALAMGFSWFIFTFIYFFQNSAVSTLAFFNQPVAESDRLLNIFLLSASLSYLSLLFFPSYRLYKNWRFVQRIKKEGLKKADITYRLFVQKIAAQLGIGKKVLVYLSELVKSPITIGYLKPIILLPVASLNNLSLQQAEAILLHELSHIRRFDYLVNLMVSSISTLLYFNPFVKWFVRTIEEERENCCDQLVLQYGYDKISYAAALLSLEKTAGQLVLVMGAAGKKSLLSRVEKITGMEKKKGFKINQFGGILAAFFCVIVFNSVLIIKEKTQTDHSFAYRGIANPFHLLESDDASQSPLINPEKARPTTIVASASSKNRSFEFQRKTLSSVAQQAVNEPVQSANIINVALDEVDASLTQEQKEKVKSTVDATKKVLSNLQWKEVENAIADAMNDKEKVKAKQEYLTELDQAVNWKNIEQNMKAQYNNMDWDKINSNLNNALTQIQLDSLQKNYTSILEQLEKLNTQVSAKVKLCITPLPDQSVDAIKKSTEELRKRITVIKTLRNPKKVVRL